MRILLAASSWTETLGHAVRSIAVAEQALAAGHEVAFLAPASYHEWAPAGVTCYATTPKPDFISETQLFFGFHTYEDVMYVSGYGDDKPIRETIEREREVIREFRPDLIWNDEQYTIGASAALEQVEVVSLVTWPLHPDFNKQVEKELPQRNLVLRRMRSAWNRVLTSYGLPPVGHLGELLFDRSQARVAPTSPLLEPELAELAELAKHADLAGPVGMSGQANPASPVGTSGQASPASQVGTSGQASPASPVGLSGQASPADPAGMSGQASPAGPVEMSGQASPAGPVGLSEPAGRPQLAGQGKQAELSGITGPNGTGVHYVGQIAPKGLFAETPSWLDAWCKEPEGTPTVYVYLSSLPIGINTKEAFEALYRGLEATGFRVIFALGKFNEIADSLELPTQSERIRFERFVPGEAVMAKAQLAIFPASHNMLMSALSHNVPCLLFPDMFERSYNAARMAEAGFATVGGEADLTPETIERLARETIARFHATEGEPRRKALLDDLQGRGGARAVLALMERIFAGRRELPV
ncbi:hypothetical protein B5M42_012290 [Paenibacillus athensensis]|uniref:Uncharacterized protein n=1 Tax=Paenibacillus athensensis TaxID=1967502 RepID=A0A4Y8Q609_9BACL|nr:hypothetical protein [Paenibacillus athensensis]MCD1259611.1 hypothetical protein [Paenibacillus athensensis]